MANEVSIIETVLTAKTDDHDKKIAASEKKLDNFGKDASDAGFQQWTKKISGDLKSLGTELTVGLTLPILAIGKQILDVGFAYEKAMNTFQAVTKATAEEMSRASQVAEQLGADMSLPATSAGDAALAMTELAKGGFTAAQAMDAAKGALQLAAAAQIDEAKAAEITANALNTFSLAAGEAGRVADLLAAASNASSAEITDIAMSMQQAGSSAAALHIPIEDLVTAIGEMANAGIKGSDAGTSLKTMMAALTPSTEKAGEAMKALGIDAFDAKGAFVGFEAIIAQAAPALAKMTDEQKAYAIEAAFGSDAQRAANIILGKGVDAFRDMKEAVSQSGAAAELAAAKTKGLSGAWDGFISQLETIGLKIFKALAPEIENFVRKLASLSEWIGKLNPDVIKMGVAIAGVAAAIGPVIFILGSLAGAIGTVISPVGLVAAAVAALGVAFATNFGGIRDTVSKWISEGKQYYETHKADLDALGVKAKEIFENYIKDLGKTAADMITLINEMKSAIDGFSSDNDGSWKLIAATVREAVFVIGSMLKLSAASFQAAALAIKAFWAPVKEWIIEPIQGAINWVKGRAGEFAEAGRVIAQSFKDAVLGPWFQSPMFIIHVLDDAAKWAGTEFPEKMKGAGKKAAEKYKEAFQEILKDINDWLSRPIGGIGGGISEENFGILLRNFPRVAKEMNNAAQEQRLLNSALELYAAMANTAAGKTTFYAAQIHYAISQLIEFDKQLNSHVTPSIAKLNNTLAATLPISEDMGEAIRKTVGTLAELTVSAKRAGDAAQQLADKNFKDLLDRNRELSQQVPDSWNRILDAVANSSGKQGAALVTLSNKYKEWAVEAIGIIDLMPGKWGDAARKVLGTVDIWMQWADKVLGVIGKLTGDAELSIGTLVSKIAGIFKGGGGGAWDAGGGFIGDMLGGAKKGGFLSGLSKWLGIAGIGASIFTGIFGLFKGKSQEQKDAEAMAKKQAALQTEEMINAVNQGIIETMSKGADLLTKIEGFTDLPRKQIKRFINQLTDVLLMFVEASKQFKVEASAHAKVIAENMGPAIELMLGGADLIEAIRNAGEVSGEKIKLFVDTVMKIADAWITASQDIEKGMAKRAEKISTLLTTSFEFLQLIPEVIKGFLEVPETISDEQINRPFDYARRIIDKMFLLADQFKEYALKKTAKITDDFARIFENTKSIFEALKIIGEYTPLPENIFDNVNSDFDRVTNWFLSAIDKSTEWLGLSETLRDNLLHLAAEMGDISNAITGAFGGAGGGAQNFTVQQSTSNPLGLGATGSSSSGLSAAGNQGTTININVQGSLINHPDLRNALIRALEEARKLGQVA